MNAPRDFWSRRRAAVEAETEAERKAEAERALAAEMAELEERSDAEILAELDLPDPDTLKSGDDVIAFMARAVPERIRRRALRKLWRLNPVLANLDGLNDYDCDYTAVSDAPVLTTYQVGKGLLAHVQEMARQAEAETQVAVADDPAVEIEPVVAEEPAAEPEAPQADVETDPPVRAPRRMRFAFDTVPQRGEAS